MRRYWINFVQDTSVFVFVVDSSDHGRFSEAFSALHEISGDERLKRVPIVLVANKQVIGAGLSPMSKTTTVIMFHNFNWKIHFCVQCESIILKSY